MKRTLLPTVRLILSLLALTQSAPAQMNAAPFISSIANLSVPANSSTLIAVTVGDLETPANNLVLTGASSNLTLVASSGIAFFGSGSNRLVRIRPLTNQIGTTRIQLQVSDAGGATASSFFLLTVTNGPPIFSPIPNRMVNAGITSAPIFFTVMDVETPSSAIVVSASSSATNLLANENIFLGGSGSNRTLQVRPALLLGILTVSLTATDILGASATTSFVLTLSNAPPTVLTPDSYALGMNSTSPPLAFTVSDLETPSSNLVTFAFSANTNLIPNENLLLSGGQAQRSLTLWPASNQIGTSVVSIVVTDSLGGQATNRIVVAALQFLEISNGMTGLWYSSGAWGDYDNDGFLDVVVSGLTEAGTNRTAIYHNNGDGTFSDIHAGLPDVRGVVAWGDYDNDGRLDLVICGAAAIGNISRIYHNEGRGVFRDIAAGLPGFGLPAVAWGDYDNDGDLDLLISGASGTKQTKIFRNDHGQFVDSGIVLPGLSDGSAAWGDYDNDGDLDLLLQGVNDNYQQFTRVFRNQGQGVFADINAPLQGLKEGSVSWGDYDNDGNLDILIGGSDTSYHELTLLYKNDGNGGFFDTGALLPGTRTVGVAWGDYDNDGYLDVAFGYGDGPNQARPAIYRNVNGAYTNSGNVLYGLFDGAIAWGDYDNDGRLDLLQTGTASDTGVGIYATKIYRNYGPITNRPPIAPNGLSATVAGRTVRLSWLPGSDPDQRGGLTYNLRVGSSPGESDVVSPMSASNGWRRIPSDGNAFHNLNWPLRELAPGTYYWSVQTIDHGFCGSPFAPEASFIVSSPPTSPSALTEAPSGVTCLDAIFNGFSDPNGLATTVWFHYGFTTNYGTSSPLLSLGDGTNEVAIHLAITNLLPSTLYHLRLCAANSAGTNMGLDRVFVTPAFSQFSEVPSVLPGMTYGQASWADFDNDGDLDLFVAGYTNSARTWGTVLLRNDGNGRFTPVPGAPYGGFATSEPWNDFDNDGNLDLLLNSGLYHNEGDHSFAQYFSFPVGSFSSLNWVDYDNDGASDLQISGEPPDAILASYLYRNNRNGNFTRSDTNLLFSSGPVVWGDYDNDGDLDALMGSASGSNPWFMIPRLLRNDGGGLFTDVALPNFQIMGRAYGVAWGDFDNDGDLDMALVGQRGGTNFGAIFRNDGNGVFTETTANLLYEINAPYYLVNLQCGDYNNDGWLDILVAGPANSHLWRNLGGGNFVHSGIVFSNTTTGVAFGDYDNDGDLDLICVGSYDGQVLTRLFRNNNSVPNRPPGAPPNLRSAVFGSSVVLSWDLPNDANQTNGFTYNLRVGTTPGGAEIMTPLADLQNGFRRVARFGNAGVGLSWRLQLPVGAYYWSVQAIDHSLAGSRFSDEGTFAINAAPPIFTALKMLKDGSFQFGFTNTSGSVRILAATNLALPLSQWTVLGSVGPLLNGVYQFTDIQSTNYPQRFYRVIQP